VWVNSRGEPLDFTTHKYLEDIYADQFPNIVYQKAGQCGLSERLISESVWVCDRLKKNSMFVFPNSSHLGDFVQARLEPVFQASEYLSQITDVMGADERREKDLDVVKRVGKVQLKQIRSNFLYLRGSQNPKQIITVDADAVFLDELDRFNQNNVPYIDKRLLHSTLKWRRAASTPTYPGEGINRAYLESDQRVWMVTCSYCRLEQHLDFFTNVDRVKRITICSNCRSLIDRLKSGRWVVQNPTVKDIHGYWGNGIYNPRKSVAEMVDDYEKALVSGFSSMQQFYNQVLGLPYEAEGQTVLRSDLEDCAQNYQIPFHRHLPLKYLLQYYSKKYINISVVKKINQKSDNIYITPLP